MKVGKTDQELKELKQNGVNDLKGFVKLKTIKKVGEPKDDPNFWAGYDFKVGSLNFQDKQRYEWFCAGFLLYYDAVVRNGAVDHTISFKWHKQRVDIYLSPPPEQGKKDKNINPVTGTSDPPKPPPPPPPPMN